MTTVVLTVRAVLKSDRRCFRMGTVVRTNMAIIAAATQAHRMAIRATVTVAGITLTINRTAAPVTSVSMAELAPNIAVRTIAARNIAASSIAGRAAHITRRKHTTVAGHRTITRGRRTMPAQVITASQAITRDHRIARAHITLLTGETMRRRTITRGMSTDGPTAIGIRPLTTCAVTMPARETTIARTGQTVSIATAKRIETCVRQKAKR